MKNSSLAGLEKLHFGIHTALKAWHATSGTPDNLLEFLLLVQSQRTTAASDNSSALLRLATNQILLEGITELASQDEVGARVLQLRFPANKSLQVVANNLNISADSVSRLQRAAIGRLAEIIYKRELAHRETHALTIETNLPPPSYTRLFGLDEVRSGLVEQLLKAQASWVITIVGMGGIGKTALADATTREIIRYFHFYDVIWLRIEPSTMSGLSPNPQGAYTSLLTELVKRFWPDSAKDIFPQQRLVQVRQLLKTRPYLIIIDNLESQTDTAYLLASLNDLAGPSKFLLTARTRPSEQTTVFSFSLDELTLADASALIHHHAEDVGMGQSSGITKADVQAIYDVVGGNPLALKLVVSLLDLIPLPQILNYLKQGREGSVESLYHYIYWQTWQVLSMKARELLQIMPLVAESGGTPEYLQKLSGLSEANFWPVLQELRHRSLVEVRGTIHEKRYGIHRLTETFLHTEIIHWPGENS